MFAIVQWLENDFLTYLAEWEISAGAQQGFTKTQQANNIMLLSHPTRLRLKMTSK